MYEIRGLYVSEYASQSPFFLFINEIGVICDLNLINITSIEAQLVEVNETIKNSEVKASFDGTVTLVDELNPGDTVQAGNQLCSVIPMGEELKVMLYIPENEISKIEIGQKTEYVFDAIPYNEYGKITGEITSISADSVVNESAGTKFYIAQADLSDLSLKNSDGNIREF